MDTSLQGVLLAAKNWDWKQTVLNNAEPCFKVEHDRKFCGRAKNWPGHKPGIGDHVFVSLADLLSYWTK